MHLTYHSDNDYCGICHTDIVFLNNEWGTITFPLVLKLLYQRHWVPDQDSKNYFESPGSGIATTISIFFQLLLLEKEQSNHFYIGILLHLICIHGTNSLT